MQLTRRQFGAVAAGLISAGAARRQAPIVIEGRGLLDSVSPATGETLKVNLRMRNALNGPLKVTRVEAFLACQGGWSVSLGESIAKEGKFFGGDPVLGARGNYEYDLGYGMTIPVTHYVLALQSDGAGLPQHNELFQVPFVSARHQAPPPLRIGGTVFVVLQEPVEVLELNSGEVWLSVVGQIINVSGKPLSLLRWRFRLRDANGRIVLDREPAGDLTIKGDSASVREFYHGYPPPGDFRRGMLEIDAEVELDGRRGPLTHVVPVERVAGVAVRSPVDGDWTWGNGPGEAAFTIHLHAPEQRYAYDIGVFKNVQGQRRTFDGDESRNESYFCWNQPIHSVKDGTVITVVDDVPDNIGHRANPNNPDLRNACIIVEHEGQTLSAYFHVRQGSATVKVGQRLRAGDILARVGNAGSSSEPHLHFGFQKFDPTGRFRTLPVRLEGMKAPDGRALAGIPKSGLEYRCTTAGKGT